MTLSFFLALRFLHHSPTFTRRILATSIHLSTIKQDSVSNFRIALITTIHDFNESSSFVCRFVSPLLQLVELLSLLVHPVLIFLVLCTSLQWLL